MNTDAKCSCLCLKPGKKGPFFGSLPFAQLELIQLLPNVTVPSGSQCFKGNNRVKSGAHDQANNFLFSTSSARNLSFYGLSVM